MERNIRLNWEVIVREARRRRKDRGLTQQRLAALAKIGRSTLNRFENQRGDVTLSSVLRILGVLDMLDRKQVGSLLLKRTEANAFTAVFAPNVGGEALQPKTLGSRESLEQLLRDLQITDEIKQRALAELEANGSAVIPRVASSQFQLEEFFSRERT